MTGLAPTNAASSGVRLDRKTLKSIAARSDRPGLVCLGQWSVSLALGAIVVGLSLGTAWMWPAMFVLGVFLTVSACSFSHECAQGTAFRTRSFTSGRLRRFLHMNMNNDVEHHLFPQVPFHALPKLADAVRDQVPEPDPGFFRTKWEVFVVTLRRSLRLSTRAPSIRQAPHMITDGGPVVQVAHRTM